MLARLRIAQRWQRLAVFEIGFPQSRQKFAGRRSPIGGPS
jgi:hypothetical protein